MYKVCVFCSYSLQSFFHIGNCAISCNSCPDPIDLTDEEHALLDKVAKYGKPQTVDVSS